MLHDTTFDAVCVLCTKVEFISLVRSLIKLEYVQLRARFLNLVGCILIHSTAVRNLMKVWKTETGPSQVVGHGLEIQNLSCLKSYHIGIIESPANQHSQSSPDGPNWLC